MASDSQISNNRANSRLSTGPSLAARAHTRYNGLKTGIRFRGEFLPTERPEEFQERVAFWTRSLKPRNAGERELVFKYARAEWVHARAKRALGARIYTQDAQAGDRADAGVEKTSAFCTGTGGGRFVCTRFQMQLATDCKRRGHQKSTTPLNLASC